MYICIYCVCMIHYNCIEFWHHCNKTLVYTLKICEAGGVLKQFSILETSSHLAPDGPSTNEICACHVRLPVDTPRKPQFFLLIDMQLNIFELYHI